MRSIIIGVAGGTGSGKTTVANRILERVGTEHIAYIPHDAYYKDLSHLAFEERVKTNFDHPNALETTLLIEHLQRLREGHPVEIPVDDCRTIVEVKSKLLGLHNDCVAKTIRLLANEKVAPLPQNPSAGKQYFRMHPTLGKKVEQLLSTGYRSRVDVSGRSYVAAALGMTE